MAVYQWWLNDPTFNVGQFQSDILIGYPFDFTSVPVIVAAPRPPAESFDDLAYFRGYMIAFNRPRIVAAATPINLAAPITESAENIIYYRGYLGRT